MKFILFLFCISLGYTQTYNLNQDYIENYFRNKQITGELKTDEPFTIRPITQKYVSDINFYKKILSSKNKKIELNLHPIELNFEYNSNYPYSKNNGTMIKNRGLQQLMGLGFFLKIGPIDIDIKPEYLFAQNLNYDGFWEGHYDEIWAKRYIGWNFYDAPERFGENHHNEILIGQSSLKININKISIGVSNKNIWWGPSIRNSIMLSNNARGFKHIFIQSEKPLKTLIGKFNFQIITGKLVPSNFLPPSPDRTYGGTTLYRPKINQNGNEGDWRYFQGYILNYSPKWIKNLNLGLIRWAQMYGSLLEGNYWWINSKPSYFPVFENLFRRNDSNNDLEQEIDQAAGVFFRWFWEDSNAEIYGEYHFNDSKTNLRDLLLDTSHSRAFTLGLQKSFVKNLKSNYILSWEWTQLQQTASELLRNAGSWYMHSRVVHGYTNYGEFLGAGIGPGSNSNYLGIKRLNDKFNLGLSLEIIDNDNDFYREAFANVNDFRRYWKDYNLHINFEKKFKKVWLYSNIVFIRSLNYQWEIDDLTLPYYKAGKDKNNIHFSLKLSYLLGQ